jgi:hypothetical protein
LMIHRLNQNQHWMEKNHYPTRPDSRDSLERFRRENGR